VTRKIKQLEADGAHVTPVPHSWRSQRITQCYLPPDTSEHTTP